MLVKRHLWPGFDSYQKREEKTEGKGGGKETENIRKQKTTVNQVKAFNGTKGSEGRANG